VSACEGCVLHKSQGSSSRKLVWVEEQNGEAPGCSQCAWVFCSSSDSTGETMDEMRRNFHAQRQHQLDANLVKSYAVDFCGTKTLREATREQVEGFVTHLADRAEKDRNALLCQLNSYLSSKEGAA
jgi:hypothetical protein